MAALCGSWLLALLWVAAPQHDVFRVFMAEPTYGWAGALGSIAAALAALVLASGRVAREERKARATKRDVLYAVKLMAARAEVAVLRLRQETASRAGIGQSVDDAYTRYGEEADRLAASTHRLTLGRGLGVEETLLTDDYLVLISRRFAPGTNPLVVELDAPGMRNELRDIERRADELLAGISQDAAS